MHAVSSVVWSALVDYALRIPIQWLVRALVLTSMTLQLILVVLGACRYFISSRILRLVVWGAYISADAVAISALGTMMHNVRSGIYAIWAPVLLMHLGGPDSITAYSMADNELWLRHGFNMLYQVCVAVYVIYAAALKGSALASAIVLLFVGFIKYGERTLALRLASHSQIVMSSLSISKYMENENSVQKFGYVIMGEDKLQRMIEQEAASSSLQERRIEEVFKAGVVTTEVVEKDNNIKERDKRICLSHALFKMYKRRFGSLYFVEGDRQQNRTFWVELGAEKAFRVVEMELKFIYDTLFSKYSSTVLSTWGILVRLLNTVLTGAAGFLILRDNRSRQAQGMVTYVLISVAVAVEAFQLWRVIISDWTRVSLICAHAVLSGQSQSLFMWSRLKVVETTMLLQAIFKKALRDGYWNSRLCQHCLLETWLQRFPLMWKLAGFFPKIDSFIVTCYIQLWHIQKEYVDKDLKAFIFYILKDTCSPDDSSEIFRQSVYNFEDGHFGGIPNILEILRSHRNLEDTILMWHIATAICDRKREMDIEVENDNVRFSRILSRYCAYLLVSNPNLLPLHPKMARIAYMQVVQRLLRTLTLERILRRDLTDLSGNDDKSVIASGAKLASVLLTDPQLAGRRWELLSGYWGKLLIYMAVYNKATHHAECAAAGGELLSHVWVLLAHMGCGEQSDSAVGKKVEMASEMELAVAKRASLDSHGELGATKKTLTERDEELAATKKTLTERDEELAATKKTLTERDEELAATKKTCDEELAATKKTLTERDEELAATKKTLTERDEELTATKKTLTERDEELAATKKTLTERDEELEITMKTLTERDEELEIMKNDSHIEMPVLKKILRDREHELETMKKDLLARK